MTSAGIFVFGVLVFALVAAACWLIAYGIVIERRDRRELEAEQARDAARDRPPSSLRDARVAGAS